MLWLALGALAAPRFDDVTCAEIPEGPPKGARALAEGVLPRVNQLRRQLHAGETIERPDADWMQTWLTTALPRDRLGARAAVVPQGDASTLVLELQAPDRPALVEANVTVIVDTSSAMATVVSPKLPTIEDGPPSSPRRPVTRMMLVKQALHDLARSLPEGSRLTVVAAGGARGRMVLPATTDSAAMHRAIDLLQVDLLDDHDAVLSTLLEETGRTSFVRCADNRAFLMTYRTDAVSVGKTLEAVKSFGAADAQIWTVGVGSFEPVDLDLWIDEQPDNHARWVLNSRQDGLRMWRTLFTAGGIAVRDVHLEVRDASDAVVLTKDYEALVSGAHQVELAEVASDGLAISLTVGDAQPEPVAIEPEQPAWARARLAAGAFAAGRSDVQHDPPRGVASEIAAWAVLQGGEAAPKPDAVLTSVWSDPSPGGPYLVADVAWLAERFDPMEARLVLDDGSTVAPIAYEAGARLHRYVFPGESTSVRLQLDEPLGTLVPVDPPGTRSANDVILRHGRANGADESLVPDGVAAAELYDPDAILTQLVARLYYDLEQRDEAVRWAEKCVEAPIASIAVDCRLIVGLVYEHRKQDQAAEKVYLDGVKRYPAAHPLWHQAGEIAFRADRLDQAEFRYLEAMATGASSYPTCVRLADVMDRRELPGLAAVAIARVLLVDPSHDELRDRLFRYLDARWEKAPRKWGQIGQVKAPRGKTSPYWFSKLLWRWGQAYRREITLDDDSTFRWATIIPMPFDILRFEQTLLSGAYRIGYTPGTIPENRVQYADEIEQLLQTWRPPIH